MDREKRELREHKREVKRRGNKHRRQKLKRDLRDNPEEAHLSLPSFGRHSSEVLNGVDRDVTRLRSDRESESPPVPEPE